jgi:methylase of polypeptide subunit release factors
VSLFLLAEPSSSQRVADAVGLEIIDLGDLLALSPDGRVRAAFELAPHAVDGDWLLASDWSSVRTRSAVTPEHVLGAGGASLMLAQCTVRPRVGRALDIGTGCGVQALSLSRHVDEIVATDVSSRALDLARFNATMNDVSFDLRQGSLFDPVVGETFDLIVSNPPFVIGSPTQSRLDYRDSGLPADDVCSRIVGDASTHLTQGGWCQLLANWEIRAGGEWQTGPSHWLAKSPLDAWVIQREVQDPASYVETWLRDAGVADDELQFSAWYDGLRERGVIGVGFGLVSLRRGEHADPVRRFQHVDQALAQPVGSEVQGWFARQEWLLSDAPADVLLLHAEVAADVRVDVRRCPGRQQAEEIAVLRESGFRWSATLDPFGAEVLDRVGPELPLGEVVAQAAQTLGIPVDEALTSAIPVLRRMVEEGFLEPVG